MRTLLMILMLSPAMCFAEAKIWDIEQLMQTLAQAKESKGKFTEKKFLRVLDRPLESSGTLLFQAPDHLEKHTITPKQETLVLEQGVLTIENKTRNTKRTLVLQEYPAIWAFVESIRSTLAGDLPSLQRFYTVELSGDAASWKMKLLPIETKTREVVSEIHISGRNSWVDSIETQEANGDHAIMSVVKDSP